MRVRVCVRGVGEPGTDPDSGEASSGYDDAYFVGLTDHQVGGGLACVRERM